MFLPYQGGTVKCIEKLLTGCNDNSNNKARLHEDLTDRLKTQSVGSISLCTIMLGC